MGVIRGHDTKLLTNWYSPASHVRFMARMARLVAIGYPHHITQRGNRRQKVFFHDEDYQAYIDLMTDWCGRCVRWKYGVTA
jgi:hypothetical protein